jgi:hypothetical protein
MECRKCQRDDLLHTSTICYPCEIERLQQELEKAKTENAELLGKRIDELVVGARNTSLEAENQRLRELVERAVTLVPETSSSLHWHGVFQAWHKAAAELLKEA